VEEDIVKEVEEVEEQEVPAGRGQICRKIRRIL